MYTPHFAQSITQRTQVLQTLRLQQREITLAPPLHRASRHLLCQPVGVFAAFLTLQGLPTLQLHVIRNELPECYCQMLRLKGHVTSRVFSARFLFLPHQPHDPEFESILIRGRLGNQGKWLAIYNLHVANSGNVIFFCCGAATQRGSRPPHS
jgi:hypothetical protein